jgi:hypothetical protein
MALPKKYTGTEAEHNREDPQAMRDRRMAHPVGDVDGEYVQQAPGIIFETQDASVDWLKNESITVSTTAVGLDRALRASHNYALITVKDEAVRYWLDGTDPTVSVGHVIPDGGNIILENERELLNFRVIEVTGTPILSISYGVR